MRTNNIIKKISQEKTTDVDYRWLGRPDESGLTELDAIPSSTAESVADAIFTGLPALKLALGLRQNITYSIERTKGENYNLFRNSINSANLNFINTCKGFISKKTGAKVTDKELGELARLVKKLVDLRINSSSKLNSYMKQLEKQSNGQKKIQDLFFLMDVVPDIVENCKLSNKKSSLSNDSINKQGQSMAIHKNNVGYHNEFYQDALKDLGNSDPLLKDFYKSLKAEYHKDLGISPQKRGDLMDFFYEEEHIMSKAHPDSIVIADARDGGEILENNLEKHKKLTDIARRKPTGNFY